MRCPTRGRTSRGRRTRCSRSCCTTSSAPTRRRGARCARWTRELIDAAVASGGRYYLPYQPVATRAQFAAAYPRATELFAVKRRVDPTGKFTNALWDLYQPAADGSVPPMHGVAPRGEPPGRGAHRARQREGLRAQRGERVPHASRVGPRLLERGVRALARAGEAAERISVRRLGGDVLALVRRHVRRGEGPLRRGRRHARHAQRDRREHGDRVRAQGTVREHDRPAVRAELPRRAARRRTSTRRRWRATTRR